MEDVEEDQASGLPHIDVASASKIIVQVPLIWDPLSSPDWDKESHSKDALVRIKRYVIIYLSCNHGFRQRDSGALLSLLH